MKVSELVDELRKYDDETEVIIIDNNEEAFTTRSVEFGRAEVDHNGPKDEVWINTGDLIEHA